jgi:hypothetical protein
VINLLAKKSTYWFLRIVGFGFLVSYLLISQDFAFSFIWVLGYFAIVALVAWVIIVVLDLPKKFPKLDRYYFFQTKVDHKTKPLSDKEWVIKQAEYFESGFQKKTILLTPSEDGLICVPIVLVGISPISAILGGLVFGFLHLGRFTYLDCIGKTIIYGLVCLFILPHGLLTVVVGHFGMDLLSLMALKIIKSKKLDGAP